MNVGWYWQAVCVATALACGLLIGIERGFDLRGLRAGSRVAGVRTFALVGLVSGLAGLAGRFGQSFAAGAIVAGAVAVMVIGYAHRPGLENRPDATTPVAALGTVGLGFVAGFGQPQPPSAVPSPCVACRPQRRPCRLRQLAAGISFGRTVSVRGVAPAASAVPAPSLGLPPSASALTPPSLACRFHLST